MTRTFKDRETKALYEGKAAKKYRSFSKQAEKRLLILDVATSLNDLRYLPSNRFEALKGKRKGQYSIRINDQWRICFEWVDNNALRVEVVDYH